MLKWFAQIRHKSFEIAVLGGYAVIVASAIAHHEPWADEAQAWQLARSLPLHDLFLTHLHFEVHPILWYVLLRILNLGHVSYDGMHWVCGAIAVVTTAIFLYASPFPRYLKALLPFTYFLLFQYVVVARGYVLVPLLLYLVAWRWKRGATSIALFLGLLANVELHAAAISGGLAVVYCIEQLREGAAKDPGQRKRMLGFVFVVLVFDAIAICTAWPSHDLAHVDVIVWSEKLLIAAGKSALWGVCEPFWLGFAFWVMFVLCLDGRRSLIYLLPALCFALFSVVYLSFWHAGLILPLAICVLWITWPNVSPTKVPYERACRLMLATVAAVQILWSINAIVYDRSHDYSGDRAAAQFLKPFVEDGTIIVTTYINQEDNHSYNAVGILPYFNQRVFANWKNSFWWASKKNQTDQLFDSIVKSKPPIVIVETRQATPSIPIDMGDPKIQSLLQSGYSATHVFCGTTPYRMSLGMTCCHLILQYAGTSRPPTRTELH